jgi:hypothetical protein
MGSRRGRVVSDTARKKPEPDAELLEFLGDIDEANDESQDEDFSDFLAHNDIDKLEGDARKPRQPVKEKND